jgi:hypothetical protein
LIFETDFKTGIEIYFLVEMNLEMNSWFHFCVEPKPKFWKKEKKKKKKKKKESGDNQRLTGSSQHPPVYHPLVITQ